jgi:uncharacterized cofD-like protein
MSHLTGDFGRAVKLSSEVLAVSGKIYPSTTSNVVLEAILDDGRIVSGETKISRSKQPIAHLRLLSRGKKSGKDVDRSRRVKPLPETLAAIAAADLITMGPGSLFTSVIPNLLVDGIPQAIAASAATKVYFMNLMTQPGETSDFLASDHLVAILRHCGPHASKMIDICVANSGALRTKVVRAYRAQEARPVEIDDGAIDTMGIEIHRADLVRMRGRHFSESKGDSRKSKQKIRHDPGVLGAVAVELAQAAQVKKNRTGANVVAAKKKPK